MKTNHNLDVYKTQIETTEQAKTYSDFWYSPLLIFFLISDRRVNYVRKPSHLINVGFHQQCFQDFRTTFFQFELKVCFMRISNLYILLFSSRLCDSGLKFMHGFCRGLTGTNISWGVPTTPDQTIQNRKKNIVAPTTLYNFDVAPIVGLLAAI